MKKYRLATIFLIAIMATGILTVATPLTSADPWSPGRGPPIAVDGNVGDWDPIKPLNVDPIGDTEAWSKNGTTLLPQLMGWGMWEINAPTMMAADACRDLAALYMWLDPATDIYLRLDVLSLFFGFGYVPPPNPGTLNASMYAITFSTNLAAGAGGAQGPYSGLCYTTPCEWEYLLVFSEFWVWFVGWNGTAVFVDGDPASAAKYGLIGNCSIACKYGSPGSIEIKIPRVDFENPWEPTLPRGALKVVSIACASFKPGLWPGVTSPFGQMPGGGAGGMEDTILHPFDPQHVIRGGSPPLAGEEFFQANAAGPDHADFMAPTVVTATEPIPGWYLVDPATQKFVDMSPLACIEVVDAATGQQNITNVYAKGSTFTVNIYIKDAINVTGVSLGLTWDTTVLDCLSFETQFGSGTFLGPSGNWIGIEGTIDEPNGRVYPPCGWANTKNPPSGDGILIKAVFEVDVDFGSSWICPVDWGMEFLIGGVKRLVEIPLKNAWFLNTPPPPGPPVLKYTQTPAAPPHYPGDPITFNLGSSTPGFNGTHWVPILNYSLTVTNSSGVIYSVEDANPIKSFTPLTPDTYTFTLDIRLDPNFDPAYTAAHPTWMHITKNVVKIVMERALTGIDCFTERARKCGYETDFLGKGHDMPADAYALDEEVTIYSYVFYNGWPKQSFIVSFEIYAPNGSLVLVRTAMTNDQGIASISFRILTVCMNPEWAFGKWRCFQKVYMCEQPYNDTLWFDVGWLVELLTVTPVEPMYKYPAHMAFLITGKNIAMITRKVVWSVVVYDDDDVPIAIKTGEMWVDPGRYCDPEPFEFVVDCLAIPKWFYPGVGKVYVNAWFNGLPTQCGHPACPEIDNVVILTAPPFVPDP